MMDGVENDVKNQDENLSNALKVRKCATRRNSHRWYENKNGRREVLALQDRDVLARQRYKLSRLETQSIQQQFEFTNTTKCARKPRWFCRVPSPAFASEIEARCFEVEVKLKVMQVQHLFDDARRLQKHSAVCQKCKHVYFVTASRH